MFKVTNSYVLIMAGGIGSRFWPKSRTACPKQFIDILGTGKSLLQQTYDRFLKICPPENIYVLTNEVYEGLVKEQLPGLSIQQILKEPCRNNTAPCIAYAAYKILQLNSEANLVVAPSDHIILKENEFIERINEALSYTEDNEAIVTLGINPTRPDTGYGYIHYSSEDNGGIHKVKAFKEKPVFALAEHYVSEGTYLWNAGIFIWKAWTIVKAFETYCPEIDILFRNGESFYNTDKEWDFILEHYSGSPNISIDYAILEKADNIYTIPADIGWSDLGTWTSLFSVAEKDKENNVSNTDKTQLIETNNCILHLPEGKLAVIRGLQDYIVVDDQQVLLIYPKSEEQAIKQEVKKVEEIYGLKFS